jgi:sterol 3beta-glucosyltransferase
MRITIITTGSTGDIHPFIALGKNLKKAGFDVRLAGPENVRMLSRASQLEFSAIDIDTQTRLRRETQKTKFESGNTLSFTIRRLRARREIALQVNRAAWLSSQKSDLIIYRIGGYIFGDSIAEKLGVPCIKVGLVPYTPTRQFPSIYLSPMNHLGSVGNWMSHSIAAWVIWQNMHQVVNDFRVGTLRLAPYSWKRAGRNRLLNIPAPGDPAILYAFSPILLPKPLDWPQNVVVTGQWALEQKSEWQPSKTLVDFLNQGQPPVYLGFGSMISQNPENILKIFKNALASTGQRGIFASGWSGVKENVILDENIYYLEDAPHEWLFPQVSLAIHHGGIGTTISSLKAGLPSIVVPFNYDQPFWGERVAQSGAGPKPIPFKRLHAENLACSIRAILEDPDYRINAARIGQQLRSENGIDVAVDLIKQTAS